MINLKKDNIKCWHFLLMVIYLIILLSCKKEIEIKINIEKSKIVVDGWIEQGKYPKVILTRSTSYFSVIDSASFKNIVLSNAKVTVSDGENSEVLTFGPDNTIFPPYCYRATDLKGEAGKTYYLEVIYYDTVLTAQTTIPFPVDIDSAYFSPVHPGDTSGIITMQITDNKDMKNYYRILTKIEGSDQNYIPAYVSVFDDEYLNGLQIPFKIYKGSENPLDQTGDIYFSEFNKVNIKLCSIDEASYQFWKGYQYEMINSINPFASFSYNMVSNINGEGYGIWSGAGVSYYLVGK